MAPFSLRHLLVLAIIVLAGAGAWFSGTLLVGHDGGWHAEKLGTGYLLQTCGPQGLPGINCAEVVGSRWGSVDFFVGARRILLPTSLIGLIYFVSVGIWFAMTGPIDARRRWTWRLTVLSVACGMAGSVFFTGVMAGSLSKWCALCVAAHVANLGIFVLTMALWRRSVRVTNTDSNALTEVPVARWAQRRLVLGTAVFVAVASLWAWLYYESISHTRRSWRENTGMKQAVAELQADGELMMRTFLSKPVVEIPHRQLGSTEPTMSNLNAELVIFTDYDCGPCACFEASRNLNFDSAFGIGLTTDYRQGPSERLKTGGSAALADPDAGDFSRAARAMQAARLQADPAAYEAMRELVLRHRRERPRRDYVDLARRAGLDVERFQADMDSETVLEMIREDLALAKSLGVDSVPAVFVNGRRVPDICLQSPAFWKTIAGRMGTSPRLARSGEQ